MSRLAIGVLGLGLASGLAGCGQGLRWPAVEAGIRREFPEVRQLSTAELAAWLADDSRPRLLLLDVRSAEEYDVSHLAGARRVDPDADPATLDLPRDRPIVAYCAVGWRSSRLLDRLREAGFDDTWNLEGSIFRWANEGRPLVRNDQSVEEVHPFDTRWGVLLDASRRAPLP